MKRRLFLGVVACFAGGLPFGVKPMPPIGGNVQLIRYVDSSLVGGTFKIVGEIDKPQNANSHYRRDEQLYRVAADGLHIDVYADEIAAI